MEPESPLFDYFVCARATGDNAQTLLDQLAGMECDLAPYFDPCDEEVKLTTHDSFYEGENIKTEIKKRAEELAVEFAHALSVDKVRVSVFETESAMFRTFGWCFRVEEGQAVWIPNAEYW